MFFGVSFWPLVIHGERNHELGAPLGSRDRESASFEAGRFCQGAMRQPKTDRVTPEIHDFHCPTKWGRSLTA
jgi:hypothetical protein